MVILEYVSDSERNIGGKKAEENCIEISSVKGSVDVHTLDVWLVLIYNWCVERVEL